MKHPLYDTGIERISNGVNLSLFTPPAPPIPRMGTRVKVEATATGSSLFAHHYCPNVNLAKHRNKLKSIDKSAKTTFIDLNLKRLLGHTFAVMQKEMAREYRNNDIFSAYGFRAGL